jgi:MFS family permease
MSFRMIDRSVNSWKIGRQRRGHSADGGRPARASTGAGVTIPLTASSPEGLELLHATPSSRAAMPRRLWLLLPLCIYGFFALQGGATGVLLGRQVSDQYSDAESVGVLGAVLALAALVGLVCQPLWGALSDRSAGRWLGKRNTWILGGAAAAAPLVLATGMATNVVVVAGLFALTTVATSAVAIALSTALPERVPVPRRGSMSGLIGVAQILGILTGLVLGGAGSILFGYAAMLVVFLITSAAFAFLAHDPSRRGRDEPTATARAVPTGRTRRLPPWDSARDFYMAAAGRFLILFGSQSVLGFLLFMLRDYIEVGNGSIEDAAKALVPISAVNGVFTLISAAVGGFLADRFARLKVFVVLSSLMFVPAAAVLFFVPTMAGIYVAAALIGLAFGTYLSVDQALVALVLPDEDKAGADLGLINIANTLPSILGPAVAGGLVALTGSFRPLFVMMAVSVLLGALTVRYISDDVR